MDRVRSSSSYAVRIEQEIRDLYATEAAALLRHAVGVAGNTETAQDAVQEAFLRLFVARRAGQEIRNPRAWLFRVLRNHLLDLAKSASRNEIGLEFAMNSPQAGHDPEVAYGRMETLRQTIRTTLTPREIECVWLRGEGLQYSEIAEVLKVNSGTVGALLTRAHKKLRAAVVPAEAGGTELALKLASGKRYAS